MRDEPPLRSVARVVNALGRLFRRKGLAAVARTPRSDRPGGELVGLVPGRLGCAEAQETLPESVSDAAHGDVAQRAIEWQQYSKTAELWEAGATVHGADEGRAHALAGQMASVGEQLGLARAAAVEVALWKAVRDGRKEPDPIDDMSIRAVAEAQSLFVYGAGHGLANVCVRALALNPILRTRLSTRLTGGRSTFPPYSNERKDWITLNASTARDLRAIGGDSNIPEVVKLVQPVAQLGESDAWSKLIERRGEDFHRWRPQTHGLAGVTKATPWKRDKPGSRSLAFGGSSGYVEAQRLADETAKIATAAMMVLTESMTAYEEAWPVASTPLGGPRFRKT